MPCFVTSASPQLKTSTHDFIIDTIRVTNPPRHVPLGVGKTWALRWENNTMPAQMEGPYKTRWNHCSQISTDSSSLEVTIPRWVSFFYPGWCLAPGLFHHYFRFPTSKHESTVRIEPFHPKYLNLRYKEIIFPQKKTSACHWLLAVVPKGPNRWNSQPWWYPNKKVMRFHIYTKKNSPKRPVHWRCRHQAPRPAKDVEQLNSSQKFLRHESESFQEVSSLFQPCIATSVLCWSYFYHIPNTNSKHACSKLVILNWETFQ